MKKLKVIAILLAITTLTNVHAVLQSRPGVATFSASSNLSDGTRAIPANVFRYSRLMEGEGGILGLNATFVEDKTADTLEETSASNNIDSHMCKNTEWGAAAMLSASNYGAGNGNVKSNYSSSTFTYGVTASTTGNMSGVFGMNGGKTRYEYLAAGKPATLNYGDSSYSGCSYLLNAPSRYMDRYNEGTDIKDIYIPGDATYETMTFAANRSDYDDTSYALARGEVFGFYTYNNTGNSQYSYRVCIWVGEGI